MTIDATRNGDKVTLAISGRLDTLTAPTLKEAIEEHTQGALHLVLDIKNLEYISSAGLRVMLTAQRKMQKIGSMTVTNPNDEMKEIFKLTGFSTILVIV